MCWGGLSSGWHPAGQARPWPQYSITRWYHGVWPSPSLGATHTAAPCRVATAPILQQAPTLLVLVNVDVPMRVDPDGMPSVPSARCGQARPACQYLPIKRQQANQAIQLRHIHHFILIDIDIAGASQVLP